MYHVGLPYGLYTLIRFLAKKQLGNRNRISSSMSRPSVVSRRIKCTIEAMRLHALPTTAVGARGQVLKRLWPRSPGAMKCIQQSSQIYRVNTRVIFAKAIQEARPSDCDHIIYQCDMNIHAINGVIIVMHRHGVQDVDSSSYTMLA